MIIHFFKFLNSSIIKLELKILRDVNTKNKIYDK